MPTPGLRPAPPEHTSDRALRYFAVGALVCLGIILTVAYLVATGSGAAGIILVTILGVGLVVGVNYRNNRAAHRR